MLVMELFDSGKASALELEQWHPGAEMGQSFLLCLDQGSGAKRGPVNLDPFWTPFRVISN